MAKTKRGSRIVPGQKALDAYTERKAEIMEAVKGGATHREIAMMLGVSERTLEYMLCNNPDVEAEWRKATGKNVAEVRAALFKRAIGEATRTVTTVGPKGSTVTTEKMPPDIQAIRIYLTNYDPAFKALTREEYQLKADDLKIRQDKAEDNAW